MSKAREYADEQLAKQMAPFYSALAETGKQQVGDDGLPLVSVTQEFKDQADYDAEISSAASNLLRNNTLGLSGSLPEMVAALLKIASEQQVGAFPWENLPSYLIDKCEGETISEEGIQRAVADMAKDARYCMPQQVGE